MHVKRTQLDAAQDRKQAFIAQSNSAQDLLKQKINDWNSFSERYKVLLSQLNAQPNLNCTAISTTNQDGSPATKQVCRENPALKPLRSEIDATKSKLNEYEAAVKQAQAAVAKYDIRSYDEEINKADLEYREAIYQSPLHSYTAMLFSKDPRQITEGEVKTLEWYLILIPSIAAALSSTLIAMTAVHRLKPPRPPKLTTLPNDAAAYLFGPLVEAIRKEAKDAVQAAVNEGSAPPGAANANTKVA